MRARRWWLLVATMTVAGLAVRLAPVLANPDAVRIGDPFEYWRQSNLIAAGVGWIEPYRYYLEGHQRIQTASLPPLYTLVLTLCSLVGLKSFFAHRVWSCIVSAAAIPLAGKFTRDLTGTAAGLIAAAVTALYPNIWVAAPTGLSETITPVIIFLVLTAAYRARKRPSALNLLLLGLILGLAILSRTDEVTLALLVVPTVLIRRGSTGAMLRAGALALVGLLVVVAPLSIYNSSRLGQPVFVTDEVGIALSQSNNAVTYSGPLAAYWYAEAQVSVPRNGSEAVAADRDKKIGLTYVQHHAGHLPLLGLERIGRTFGLYRARQQIGFDIRFERRPTFLAWAGAWSYYVLALLAIPAVFRLRRRGIWLLPMAAIGIDVVASTVLTYGNTRFRTPLEPVIVVLASVTLAGISRRFSSTRTSEPAEATPAPRSAA